MSPERWRQVSELFEAALAREATQRAAFLREACADDQALRLEVDSLLAAHAAPDSLFDEPLSQIAAEILTSEPTICLVGRTVGSYTIERELGRGGMSEVYLAHDTRLNRLVALKLLSASFTRDADRLLRFEREARAVSALNHPNIVTIHEICETDDLHFIITEYIEGETLRQLMLGRRLKLSEALDIAIQAATALAAAHQVGIIHRDIKPENIMVRRDGYVKVLDFGLAKLLPPETHSASGGKIVVPLLSQSTRPGMVLGTVAYMCPEQARGREVDQRADIWSLGVVLYEMVIGHLPFEGETSSHVIVSILEKEPPPLSDGAPAQLQWIVSRALEKNKEVRYQTALDFYLDLKNLKQELEFSAEPHRSDQPSMPRGPLGQSTDRVIVPASDSTSARSTNKHHFGHARSYRPTALIVPALALATVVAYGLYRWSGWDQAAPPFQLIDVIRITGNGRARLAVMTLDGRYVAYVTSEAGRQGLVIRQLSVEGESVLVPPAEAQYRGVTFSPAGTHVYYVVASRNDSQGALYVIPVLAGKPKRVLAGVSSPITFSPDGKQLAFVREDAARGENSLMIAEADGSDERRLAVRHQPDTFTLDGPAWSPDGRMIACSVIKYAPEYREDLVGFQVDGNGEALLTPSKWVNIGRVAGSADMRGLIIVGRAIRESSSGGKTTDQDPQTQDQLWFIPYPAGQPHRITHDMNRYRDVSLTSDAGALVSVLSVHVANIWEVSYQAGAFARATRTGHIKAGPARQLTQGLNRFDGVDGLACTPAGGVVYVSAVRGFRDLWVIDPEGGPPRQLTDDQDSDRMPVVSPDGRTIVFASPRGGERNLWRMGTEGGGAKQITKGKLESFPCFSPDGRWVVYTSIGDGLSVPTVWKVPIEGGTPVRLTEKLSFSPVVSHDGRWIAYFQKEGSDSPARLEVIPFEGGAPLKVFDVPASTILSKQPLVRWSPGDEMLIYVDTRDGVSNVWGQPVAGGRAVQLTSFEADEIFWFDWCSDGRRLVVSRGNETSDVVLIKDLK